MNEDDNEEMTIRDHFAIEILKELIALNREKGYISDMQCDLAGQAYRFADTMLAEREKKGGAQ